MNESKIKCEFVQRQMESFNRERSAIISHDKRLELLSVEAQVQSFYAAETFTINISVC